MRKSGLQDFELSKSAAATLFATSRPVDTLSFFISHSWRAPGAAKRTALAFYFNGRRAALGATLCAVLLATLARFRVLPSGGGFRDEGFDTRLRLPGNEVNLIARALDYRAAQLGPGPQDSPSPPQRGS